MSERTVTVAEAAQALGITEKAVRRRIERKALPSILGADRRRRIPASALGLDSGGAAVGQVPHRAPSNGHAPASDLLDRLERLARENGALRQIELVAGDRERQLIEANARIRELEAQLDGERLLPAQRLSPSWRSWWRR